MPTRYGQSPWIDRFPKSRVPAHPRYRGATKTDVVVVGGGLTGCATAYAFAAAGVKVILLEAGQIGRGTTAYQSGWVSEEPGVRFADLEKAIGARGAGRAFQMWRRAALDFAALLRRLDVKCDRIPSHIGVRMIEESMRYKVVKIRNSEFLLPRNSQLAASDQLGNYSLNMVSLEGCREFSGDSVVTYDAPVGNGASSSSADRQVPEP